MEKRVTSSIDQKIEAALSDINNKIRCLTGKINSIEQSLLAKNIDINQAESDFNSFKTQLAAMNERLTTWKSSPR